MEKRRKIYAGFSLLIALLSFLLGVCLALQPYSVKFVQVLREENNKNYIEKARDVILARIPEQPFQIRERFGRILGVPKLEFPTVIESQRYILEKKFIFPVVGQYHLTQNEKKEIFAVDRNNGELFSISGGVTRNMKLLGNIFDLIQSHDQTMKPYRINDLHFFADRFYISGVLLDNEERKECGSIFSFSLVQNKAANLKELLITPCIEDRLNPGMWGGRMTSNKESLFVSIGEQRFDRSGFPKLDKVARKEQKNSKSIFGCVLEFFDLPESKSFNRYSCGHRNAQGLFFSDEDNQLYESEHGPLGGDELNLLSKGKHYGWPFVSLGNAYGVPLSGPEASQLTDDIYLATDSRFENELLKYGFKRGVHSNYTSPALSITPSIGPSAILQISSKSVLEDWKNNLLLSSLRGTSIYRIVMQEKRVLALERIPIGFRIRDILITDEGVLYLSTDENLLVEIDVIKRQSNY